MFKEYAADQPGEAPNNLSNRDPGNHFSLMVGIMAYWEAMASFLFDQGSEGLTYLLLLCDEQGEQIICPNPWSGISDRLFVYMAQAGALSRQKLLANRLSKYISAAARDEIISKQHREASELVRRLLQFKPPNQRYIQGPGDKSTPLDHLLRLAQVYKLSILLQIYLSFPGLVATDQNVQADKSIPKPQRQHFDEPRQNFIITLATSILNIMGTIPEGSRVNIFLTLPLIIAGSVLQRRRTNFDYCNSESTHPAPGPSPTIERELSIIRTTDYMIHHWRSFVRNRLGFMHKFVALEPISRAL